MRARYGDEQVSSAKADPKFKLNASAAAKMNRDSKAMEKLVVMNFFIFG